MRTIKRRQLEPSETRPKTVRFYPAGNRELLNNVKQLGDGISACARKDPDGGGTGSVQGAGTHETESGRLGEISLGRKI